MRPLVSCRLITTIIRERKVSIEHIYINYYYLEKTETRAPNDEMRISSKPT